MRRLLFVIVAMMLCVSCAPKNEDGSIRLDSKNANDPHVVVIDSCEYIKWGYGLTHKGNCKFCAERREKEYEVFLEDIVIELY